MLASLSTICWEPKSRQDAIHNGRATSKGPQSNPAMAEEPTRRFRMEELKRLRNVTSFTATPTASMAAQRTKNKTASIARSSAASPHTDSTLSPCDRLE